MSGIEFGSLRKELEDPVSFDPLFRAMTLQPCGHNCNEDTLKDIRDRALNEKMQPTCPFCRQVIISATPNYTIRNLAHKIFDEEKPSKNPPREKESANEEMEEKQKAPVEKKEDDRAWDYLQETASVRAAAALSSDREESKAPSECYVSSFDGHPLFYATPELAKNLAQLAVSYRAPSSSIQRHRKEEKVPRRVGRLSEFGAHHPKREISWEPRRGDGLSAPEAHAWPSREDVHGERDKFGDEDVDDIYCSSSLTLCDTRVAHNIQGESFITLTRALVKGTIVAAGSIKLYGGEYKGHITANSFFEAHDAILSSVTADGSATLTGCDINNIHANSFLTFTNGNVQEITADGSVTLKDCTCTKKIATQSFLKATHSKAPTIYADGSIELKACIATSVETSSSAKIFNCQIETVTAEGEVQIRASEIQHLSCHSNNLILQASNIETLVVYVLHNTYVPDDVTNALFQNSHIGSLVVTGSITVNGRQICGPGALIVNGQEVYARDRSARSGPQEQILELRSSRVGKVFFEGGHGHVITDAESSCEEVHQELEKR